jgi:predicted CoA-substrate-specific enzyme activase
MICAGIDAGSRTIKIVLMDIGPEPHVKRVAKYLACGFTAGSRFQVVAKGLTDQGVAQDKLTLELFDRLLKDSKIRKKDVRRVVATGYGRNAVSIADTTITEITCHAVGVRRLVPNAMTIIDIGGEDSKLIRLDKSGKVRDFAMNDRCAAGTGRFLEVVARRLGVHLPHLGEMAAHSRNPAAISSMCVVFAETEIIGLLTAGTPAEDIIAGVQAAIAARVMSMIGRKADLPIVFTGGVAMITGMDRALESALGQEVTVAPDPQMTGALGAAILACNQVA